MGSILGGPPGDVVGVAPEAEWIAVKIFRDSGSTSSSIIHDGFQWMLAPGGDPAKAPRVVNNSWGSTATYTTEFLEDVARVGGCRHLPGLRKRERRPRRRDGRLARQLPRKLRGRRDGRQRPDRVLLEPRAGGLGGVTYVKPQVERSRPPDLLLVAAQPAGRPVLHDLRDLMATPHVTGVVALLLSAKPDLSVDAIRELLTSTARREPHMGKLPNNDYGTGIVDAYAAITAARFSSTLTGVVRGLDGPIAARVSVPALGVETTSDPATGFYELTLKEGTWTVEASAYGFVGGSAQVSSVAGAELVRDFTLDEAVVHTLSGTVTAGGEPVAAARVQVEGTPLPPAYADADGEYSLEVAAGAYTVAAAATGYERASRPLTVDGDETADFVLEPLAGAIEAGWDEYQSNPARSGLSAEELAAGALTESWAVDLPDAITFASPVVAGGRIYVAGDAGRVNALDLEDGSVEWTFPTGAANRSTPAVADGKVYVGGGDSGVFYALDAATGTPDWSYPTGDRLRTRPRRSSTARCTSERAGGRATAAGCTRSTPRTEPSAGSPSSAPRSTSPPRSAADACTRRATTPSGSSRSTRQTEASSGRSRGRATASRQCPPTRMAGSSPRRTTSTPARGASWRSTRRPASCSGRPPGTATPRATRRSPSPISWSPAPRRTTGSPRTTARPASGAGPTPSGRPSATASSSRTACFVGGSQQDHRAWALDAYTGDLLWEDTVADNVLSAPALADGRLIVADRSGGVHAYEAPGVVAGTVEGATPAIRSTPRCGWRARLGRSAPILRRASSSFLTGPARSRSRCARTATSPRLPR